LNLGRAQVRYSGRWVAKGFDFPGRVWAIGAEADAAVPGGNDFIVAPTDPVNLPDFRVVTHRLTVVVPLSGGRRQTRR
jgi:hypothetical protein